MCKTRFALGPKFATSWLEGEGSANGIGQGMGMWTYSDSVWGLDLLDLQLHEKNSRLPPNFLHFFALDGWREGSGGQQQPKLLAREMVERLHHSHSYRRVGESVSPRSTLQSLLLLLRPLRRCEGVKKNACFGFFFSMYSALPNVLELVSERGKAR